MPHYSFYTGVGIIDGRDTAALLIAVIAVTPFTAVLRICNTNKVTLANDISRINENKRHVRRIYGNRRSNT
jgi:hypothetical protein